MAPIDRGDCPWYSGHSMDSVRRRGTELAAGVALLLMIAGACEHESSAPEEMASTAKAVRSAEVASAAVAASGAAPIGAPPVLLEEKFVLERPTSFGSPAKTTSCALDRVADSPASDVTTINRNDSVRLVGWAADGATSTVPPVIVVELAREKKKSLYLRAHRLSKRPDVATSLGVPAFTDSGYDVLGTLEAAEPGEYTVNVLQVTEGGDAIVCDTRKKLKVD
jgi:hypothetical protein